MSETIKVVISERRAEAEEVISLELTSADGRPLPAFSAGAHIDLRLPGGLVRQYSLCNDPAEAHRYLIAVLREPNSRGGSIQVHELHAGDLVQISQPRNHFSLVEDARRSILVAGGIGITPIISMADALTRSGKDFELHYCTRSRTRTPFISRVRHAAFASRAHLHHDDGLLAQKLDAAALLSNRAVGTHLYVCGPAGFMQHVLGAATHAGWPGDALHREHFTPRSPPESGSAGKSFTIELARSGRRLEIPANRSVAEQLLANGIQVPLSCESGVCGTCLTRVLAGEPDHRDVFQTSLEQARNDHMTLCVSRSRSDLLVLDL